MAIVNSAHALNMLAERNIDRTWVERTVTAPDFTEPDITHADRTRHSGQCRSKRGVWCGWCMVRLARTCGSYCVSRPRQKASTMKTQYDSETDALYIRFTDAAIVDTGEVRPGIMLDGARPIPALRSHVATPRHDELGASTPLGQPSFGGLYQDSID